MSWTDPQTKTEEEELFEKLKELPMRDHVLVVTTLTLCSAFQDHNKIEASHFKDLTWAAGRSIKHIATCDTLKFLIEQLEKAPEGTTVKDILTILALMGLKAQESADRALRDVQRLAALLPSDTGEQSASK